jgi:CheY-like chemotaxis protein
MVSAYARQELIDQSNDAGIDSYLVKPVNPSMLLDAIMDASGHQGHKLQINTAIKAADHIRGAQLLLVEDNEINQQIAEKITK